MYPGTHAAVTPDKAAVIAADSGRTLTYGELETRSARLANHLTGSGLSTSDVVVMLSENDPAMFEVYWAALRSGMYVTAVNHQLSAREVAYIVRDSGASAIVVSAGRKELAESIVDEIPGVKVKLAYGGPVSGYHDYESALAAASPEPPADQPRGSDMLYSSGTTGLPKGIKPPLPGLQVHEPGAPFVAVLGAMYGFAEDTVYLSPAPLYHAAPLRFCGVVHAFGGTVVIMDKFDAERSLRYVEQFAITHSQWVPTMFVRMLKLDPEVRSGYSTASMRVAIHAAAPCPADVKRQMIDWWGPVIQEYYGSTEGNGLTFIDSRQWLEHPGSVGKAGLGIIHVCDPDGSELPIGENGLVYFEREVLPFEYHNDPEKTRSAQHPRNPTWTTTGDIGHVDSEGYLYLADRQAFVIISGGVNIYPREVEDCLIVHPAVYDIAVVGAPDEEMGESVKAVVQVADGVPAGAELAAELIAYARERLAGFKVPRTVEFVDVLPRTDTGKLVKHKLRAQ
jgi:long-chain acyl-CoA synthetase